MFAIVARTLRAFCRAKAEKWRLRGLAEEARTDYVIESDERGRLHAVRLRPARGSSRRGLLPESVAQSTVSTTEETQPNVSLLMFLASDILVGLWPLRSPEDIAANPGETVEGEGA